MASLASYIQALPSRRFWTLVLFTGLLLRVSAVLFFGDLRSPQLYESGGIARHIVAGKGYSTVFPILYPEYGHVPRVYDEATPSAFTLPGFTLIVAAVFSLLGEGSLAYLSLYLLNIAASLLSVVLISKAAGLLIGTRTARWTALLAALYPSIAVTVATFGGAPWYHLVMSLSLWLLLRAAVPSAGMSAAILFGVAAGLWTMFRAEGFAAAILLAVWLGWNASWRRAAIAVAVLLLMCVPWAARNTAVFGKVVPFTTNVWLNAWRGNNAASTGGSFNAEGGANWLTPAIRSEIEALPHRNTYELAVMEIYRRKTIEFINGQPVKAAGLYARKMLMFFTIDFSDKRARSPVYWLPNALLILGAGAGGFLLLRKRIDALPVAGIIAVNALIVSALHVESRYQLILAVLYIIPFAYALTMLSDRSADEHAHRPLNPKGSSA